MPDYLEISGRVRTIAYDGVVVEAQEVKDLLKNKSQQELNNDFSTAIEAILLLIPSAASSLNKLADKAFVNSSIATASATFRGTYNLVSDLNLTVSATHAQIGAALAGAISDEDNNDYGFVQVPTSDETPTQIAKTERYKFNGTEWEYEYDLNNSGYTADQWAAINSGINAALVTKLSALPTNADLTTALGVLTDGIAAINAKIPSAASSSNKLVDAAAMQSYITQVLDTIDATFNVNSTDGHITVQITQVNGVITNVSVTTSDIASADALTLVTGRVTDAEANIVSLGGRMTTAEDDIDDLQQLYNNLKQSAPVVIEPTDTWPVAVADRSATVIYRVVDRVNTPPQYYSDYMFRASDLSGQPVLMAKYDNAIDPRPKKGSQNLVTSGGVFDNMGALDVSELNATENPHTLATYADLSAAIAAIPSDYRNGGMSIKFVQSSYNKYVQARCMAQNFSTGPNDWQGVDDEPTAGSDNLVKSGGVYPIAKKTEEIVIANSDDENERISLQTESDVEFASITPTETNFTGLKSDGKKVLKEENSYEDLGTDEKIVLELSNGEVIAEFDTNGARFKNIGFTNSDYNIVEDINSRVKKQSLKVRIPDVVYAIEGVELNLYNDTVALSCDKGLISPINYKVVWTCTKGKITERGYRFTPQASDVGNVSCKCSVYNIENELLDEKTFTIKVVSKNGISSSKRILFCGDSLGQVTAQVIYADFHSELFSGTIPTMVGSTGTTAKGLYYGGWKWRFFASAGEIMYRCQVSGITSLSIGARYVDEDNGLFTVEEVNLTDGAGNVLMRRLNASGYDSHPLASSGILTKVEGAGDNQFSFTSQDEPGNPLWNASESKLDVAGYRTKIGLASNEKIDMVIFQLGVNDAAGFIYPIVKQQVREDIVSLYEAFIEDNPNCLFVIGNDPVGCNTADGFGSNYGVTNIERFKQHYDELCGIYLDFDEDKTNYPNLRLINENFTIDRYYGYPFSETKISERYPTTENTHSNAWHPASSGYAQLGDSVFAAIVNLLNV